MVYLHMTNHILLGCWIVGPPLGCRCRCTVAGPSLWQYLDTYAWLSCIFPAAAGLKAYSASLHAIKAGMATHNLMLQVAAAQLLSAAPATAAVAVTCNLFSLHDFQPDGCQLFLKMSREHLATRQSSLDSDCLAAFFFFLKPI